MSPESCREGPHLIIEHQVSEVARGALIPHQRAGQYSRRRKTCAMGMAASLRASSRSRRRCLSPLLIFMPGSGRDRTQPERCARTNVPRFDARTRLTDRPSHRSIASR
jgi:hypothetical protein